MTLSEIFIKLKKNKNYQNKPVSFNGIKFWLDFREYCNSFGGVIIALVMEIKGEEYYRNPIECEVSTLQLKKLLSYY